MKPECYIGQPFGANYNGSYAQGGLKGHTAVDNACGFGTPIHAYWGNEYVYKDLTKDHPSYDGTGFTGVFTLVDDERGCFEFLYGHCNPSVTVGQILTKGDVLGTEANNGEVYSGNIRITLEMQKNGDERGHHRHDQMRLLRKDQTIKENTNYLSNTNGTLLFKGGYFAIPDYYNGYAGCVDWTKIDPAKFLFTKDLYIGMKNNDVLELQKRLVKEGFGTFEPTGFFGTLTLKALVGYQKAKRISPALGYCGKLTRAELNK
jgi:hypothetical protein